MKRGNEKQTNSPKSSHSDVRQELLTSAVSLRIYGIQLENTHSLDGYFAVWFCGLLVRGQEVRDCRKRIWHIPKAKVLASGEVRDFTCDGQQVQWFDVEIETMLIEEQYTPISLNTGSAGHPRALFRAIGGAFSSCKHQCLETLGDCVKACNSETLHPTSMGWTPEQRASCVNECYQTYRRCEEECERLSGGHPFEVIMV